MKKRTILKNKLTLALASLALLGSVGYAATVGIVRADFDTENPLVQALSEKFGLNENEVADALDEIRADHFAQMQENREERLNQAVLDGVITEEQKNALMEKHQEMEAERSQRREQHRTEMDAWFAEQGIDHDALMEYVGGFGPMGMGMHEQFGGGFRLQNSN